MRDIDCAATGSRELAVMSIGTFVVLALNQGAIATDGDHLHSR
jgi:hypothetical protein